MKRLMIIFGLLDLSIVATYAGRVPTYLRGHDDQMWVNIACLTVMMSLLVSAYGLLRGRVWSLVLGYVQFPFKIALALLSFAWLAQIILPADPSMLFHQSIWIAAVAVEGVRLGLTIMVHRQLRARCATDVTISIHDRANLPEM